MALKQYYFPSETGYYKTLAGNLRIEIRQEVTTAEKIDTNCDLLRLSQLKYPFILANNLDYAFSRIDLTFKNNNNFFETSSIFDEAYQDKTEILIYLNDAVFWVGIIDFHSIKRDKYYLNSNQLFYREIKFLALDLLYYHKQKQTKLSDVSYADGITLYNLLVNIVHHIDSSFQVIFDDQLEITEPNGNEYFIKDLKINQLDENILVVDFLKDLSISLGIFLFNRNGYFYLNPFSGGNEIIIDTDKIKEIKKIKRENVDYTKLSSIHDWSNETGINYEKTDYFELGNIETLDENKINHQSTIISKLYTQTNSSGEITNYYAFEGNYNNYCKLKNVDVLGDGYETGDIFHYNYDGTDFQSVAIITDLNSYYDSNLSQWVSEVWFYPGDTVDTDKQVGLEKAFRRYKQKKIIDLVKTFYNNFYFTNKKMIQAEVKDISNLSDISKKFIILNTKHKISSLSIDFIKNELFAKYAEVT